MKYIKYNVEKDIVMLVSSSEEKGYNYIDVSSYDYKEDWNSVYQDVTTKIMINFFTEQSPVHTSCLHKIEKFNSVTDFHIKSYYIGDYSSKKVMYHFIKDTPKNIEFSLYELAESITKTLQCVTIHIDDDNYKREKFDDGHVSKSSLSNHLIIPSIQDILFRKIEEKKLEGKELEEQLSILYENSSQLFSPNLSGYYNYSKTMSIEKMTESTFRYMVKSKKYFLKNIDNVNKISKAIEKSELLRNNITDEFVSKFYKLSDSYTICEFINYSSQKDFDIMNKVFNIIQYIKDKRREEGLTRHVYYREFIINYFLLCRHHNYDVQELADYLLSLPFAQGITDLATSASMLYELNLINKIKVETKFPANLKTMHTKEFKSIKLYSCNHCKSILLSDSKCKICGSKGKIIIEEDFNLTYSVLSSKLCNETSTIFTKIHIEDLFNMKIEYYFFKLKKESVYHLNDIDNFINKTFKQTLDAKELESNSLISHCSVDIDFKREEQIIIRNNGKKSNSKRSLLVALTNIQGLINKKLNLDLNTPELIGLYNYPILELLYKTRYKTIIPHIVCQQERLSDTLKNNITTIKELFPNRNKNELKILLDYMETVKKSPSDFEDCFEVLFFDDLSAYNININQLIQILDIYIKYGNYKPMYRTIFKNIIVQISSLINNNYTICKIIRYIEDNIESKCFSNLSDITDYLVDYIKTLDLLNPEGKKIRYDLYPKDLILSHDRASFLYSMKKNEIMELNFSKQAKINKSLERIVEEEKYAIISPTSTDDLKNEGLSLSHCVGTYINSYAEGRSKIFFLRTQENIDVSLVTLEINELNNLRQSKGLHNRQTTTEENKFIEKWIKDIKRNEDKKQIS